MAKHSDAEVRAQLIADEHEIRVRPPLTGIADVLVQPVQHEEPPSTAEK